MTRKTATSLACGAAGLILLPFSPEVLGSFVPMALAGLAAGGLCWLLADYVNVVDAVSLRLRQHALSVRHKQARRAARLTESWSRIAEQEERSC